MRMSGYLGELTFGDWVFIGVSMMIGRFPWDSNAAGFRKYINYRIKKGA